MNFYFILYLTYSYISFSCINIKFFCDGLFCGRRVNNVCVDCEQAHIEKCYDGLGCVKITPEWGHKRYRPINLLPSDRHAINTIFVHWRYRDGKLTPDIIGTEDVKTSGISGQLKLLIHDFTSNGYTGWITHLASIILSHPDGKSTSVVSVDWAAGAEPPYVQAVANARLVALEVVLFLNKLQRSVALGPGRVHAIGHGVGAHIAGYVGKMLRLRMITGLDPSGEYFQRMPPIVHLCQDDADYVEVLHTDGNGQGTVEKMGHVDYYANGGLKQPDCQSLCFQKLSHYERSDLKLGEIIPGCSHKRSLKYYIESLAVSTCAFVGIACQNYKDFLKGKCTDCGKNNENCAQILPLSPPPTQEMSKNGFFFLTSDYAPFCCEMLKILLKVRNKENSNRSYVKGYYNVTIPQDSGDVSFTINENSLSKCLHTDKFLSFVVFRSVPPVLKFPIHVVNFKWVPACVLAMSWMAPPEIMNLTIQKLSELGSKPQYFCQVDNSDVLGLDMTVLATEPTTYSTHFTHSTFIAPKTNSPCRNRTSVTNTSLIIL